MKYYYFILFILFYLIINIKSNSKLINDNNIKKSKQLSENVRQSIRQFRGGDDKLYNNLLKSLTILLCENNVNNPPAEKLPPNERFVNKDDPLAYKNIDEECILIENPELEVLEQYNKGLCEVKPNCYWNDFNTTDSHRLPIYDTGASAANRIPDDSMTLQEANNVLREWLEGLIKIVIPGILLAGLSLLTMVLFLFFRCCCNKCGGRNPRPEGYTCSQKLTPLFFHLIFTSGIITCLALSHVYNNNIVNSIGNTFKITEDLLLQSKDWIVTARQPLISVRDAVFTTVDDIKTQLNGTDFIEDGLNGITSRVRQFGETTADVTLPNNCTSTGIKPCFPCQVCTTINEKVNNSTEDMDKVAGDGVKDLKNSRNTINNELVTVEDLIHSMVSDKINETITLEDNIENAKQSVSNINKEYDGQEKLKEIGLSVIFAFNIMVLVISIIGIIFGLSPCKFLANILHLSYFFGFFALIFGFIIASLMLAFAVIFGDSCELILIMKNDWEPYVGAEASRGINACFRNKSLIDAYNLSDSLDFTELIKFPETEFNLNFSTFDTFNDEISKSNSSTFNMEDSFTKSIKGFNEITGINKVENSNADSCYPNDKNYTKNNLKKPWLANSSPTESSGLQYITKRYDKNDYNQNKLRNCDAYVASINNNYSNYKDLVVDSYKNITTLYNIENDSETFINNMKTSMNNLNNYIDTFKSNITKLENNLENIENSLKSSLYKSVDDFKNAMFCEFISDGFDDVVEEMCGTLMPSFLMIALFLLLSSVFLIPITIINIILCKRLKAPGNGSHIPDETEFK